MQSHWNNTISGINEYLSSIEDKSNTHVTISTFRGKVKSDLVSEIREVGVGEFKYPGGMTPLYDNIGAVYQQALEAGHAKTAIIVVTDGEENASNKVNEAEVKRIASVLREKEWPLTFIGASFDKVVSEGAKVGLDKRNTMSFNVNDLSKTKGAFRDLGARTMAYASAVGGQSLTSFEYSETARKEFGGQ